MTKPFLRPEARAWINRWGEALAAAGVAALGLWWLLAATGLLVWVGGALAVLGGAAALAAVQRARFRSRGQGAGVVELDEGRLTYFGPLTGGSVAIRDIVSIAIDPKHHPAHWVICAAETEVLIPVDAEGVDALFDVFAQLPGLDPRTVLAASSRPHHAPATLWQRHATPAARRLPRS